MKKFISIFIFSTVFLFCATMSLAKTVDLEISYTLDEEFEEYVTSYNLYTEVPDSGEKVLVATLDPSGMDGAEFEVAELDLRPGQITNFYLSAVYDDVEDMSEVYEFKYTGRPVIISIIKK